MVEGACLESMYTLIAYQGFESLALRQYFDIDEISSANFREGSLFVGSRFISLLLRK